MAALEKPTIFIVNGVERLVCTTVLLWLVDHLEGNKICHLKPLACRCCVMTDEV
jgi:hypothetical protein